MLNPRLLGIIAAAIITAATIPFAFWLRATLKPPALRKLTFVFAVFAFWCSAFLLFETDEHLFVPVLIMIVVVGLLSNLTSEHIKRETSELRAKIEKIEKQLSKKA